MKVAELLALLTDLPGDMDVIMSSDEEGNSYNTLSEAAVAWRESDDDYELFPLSDEDIEDDGYDSGDLVAAVYLWP